MELESLHPIIRIIYVLRPKDPSSLISLENLTEEDLQALSSLSHERSWWSRLWVVQEFTYAKEARIVCGNRQATWDMLHNIFWRDLRLKRPAPRLSEDAATSSAARMF
jgi:hypothetical protein